ncbi:hypothetical protein D3C80_1891360 [compost metagenome]
MSDPRNPYSDWPLLHMLFVKVRDGGGPAKVAHGVAKLHGIMPMRRRLSGGAFHAPT